MRLKTLLFFTVEATMNSRIEQSLSNLRLSKLTRPRASKVPSWPVKQSFTIRVIHDKKTELYVDKVTDLYAASPNETV